MHRPTRSSILALLTFAATAVDLDAFAAPSVNNNAGTYTDLITDSQGFLPLGTVSTDPTFDVQFFATGGGYVGLPSARTIGHATTQTFTAGPKSGWRNVYLKYTGNASTIVVTFINPAATAATFSGFAETALGTIQPSDDPAWDGMLSLATIPNAVTAGRLRFNFSTSTVGTTEVKPTLGDLRVTWIPQSEIRVGLSSPVTVDSGSNYAYAVQVAVNNVNADDLVVYVPMPRAPVDPFSQPRQLAFVSATNGGQFTSVALTRPGLSGNVTIPANSVYWDLGDIVQGTTTRMLFTVQVPVGTLSGTAYGAPSTPATPPTVHGFSKNAPEATTTGNLTTVNSVVRLWTDKTTSGTYLLNSNHHARRSDTVTWTLQVANWRQPQSTGSQYYPDAQIRDCPDANFLTAVGGMPGITIHNSSNGVPGSVVDNCIIWNVGSLAVGQTVTATYSAMIQTNTATDDGDWVDNTVTLRSNADASVPGATATISDTHRVYFGIPETPSGFYAKGVRIRGSSGVSATDDLPWTYVTYGEQFTWLLHASNTAASSLRDILMVERVTDGTSFVSASLPAGVSGTIYYHDAASGTDDAPATPPDINVANGTYVISSTGWRVYNAATPPAASSVKWVLFDIDELSSGYSAFAENPGIPSMVTAEVTVMVDMPTGGTCPTPTLKNTASFNFYGYERPLEETVVAVEHGGWVANMEPVQVVARTPGFTLSTAAATPNFLSNSGSVTYTINVVNQLPGLNETDNATPVTVTIQVPTMTIAGIEVPMPYTNLSFSGGAPLTVNETTTTISVTYASMAGGATRQISFTASTLPSFTSPESFVMTASIAGTDDVCGVFSHNVAAGATIDASPWLVVQKSSNLSNVAAGSTFNYTLSYTNVGPAAATNSYIVDLIPAGTTFNSAQVPTPGGTVWFATATGKAGCPGLPASLSDSTFIWSANVINNCFVPAINPSPGVAQPSPTMGVARWIAFGVDNGTLSPPQLPVGTFANVTFSLTVGAGVVENTILRNNASVFSDKLLAAVSNDTIVLVGNQPSMNLALSCPGVHAAGETGEMSLVYYNDSTTVADTASVVMNLPVGYSFVPGSSTHAWNTDSTDLSAFTIGQPTVSGTAATGQALTWNITAVTGDLGSLQGGTFTIEMTAGQIASGTLSQVSALGFVTLAGNATQLQSSASCSTLVQNPDLCIDKSVFQPEPLPGESLTWYVKVNNIGLNDAFGVVVTDTLPAGFTYVPGSTVSGTPGWTVPEPTVSGQTLTWANIQPPGGLPVGYFGPSVELRFRFNATLASNTPAGTTLTNFVAVSTSTLEDTNCANTDLTPVTTPYPNVWVEKSGPATGIPGQTATFRLRYGNLSRAPAGTVVLIDDVPDLNNDGQADLTFTLPATLAPGATLYVNTAANNTAAPAFNLSNPGLNGWTTTLPTAPARVNWVAIVHPNLGDNTVGPYSAFLTFALINPSTGLPVSDAQTFNNCATIAMLSGDTDSDTLNNSDCAPMQTPGLDLAAAATCLPSGSIPGASIGDDIAVALSATNPATRPVYGVTLTWTPPSGFEVLGTYNPAPATLSALGATTPAVIDLAGNTWSGPLTWSKVGNTWYLGSLDTNAADYYRKLAITPGTVATLTVYGVASNGLSNNFVITHNVGVEPDNRPSEGLNDPEEDIKTNNADSCNLTIYLPDPFVEKEGTSTSATAPYTSGDIINYTLSFNNAGGTAANDVTLIDTFPPGMGYVVGSLSNVPDGSTVTWTCCDSATPCAPQGDVGDIDTNICGVEFHWDTMPAPANATTLFDTTAQFDTGGYANTISTSGSVYINPQLDATIGTWTSPVIPTAAEGSVVEWIRLPVAATYRSDDATLSFDIVHGTNGQALATGLTPDTSGGINITGLLDAATVPSIRIVAHFDGTMFSCDYIRDHATMFRGILELPLDAYAYGCTGPNDTIYAGSWSDAANKYIPYVWSNSGSGYAGATALDTGDSEWGGEPYLAFGPELIFGELWGDNTDHVYWTRRSGTWELRYISTQTDNRSWIDDHVNRGWLLLASYESTSQGYVEATVFAYDDFSDEFYPQTLPLPAQHNSHLRFFNWGTAIHRNIDRVFGYGRNNGSTTETPYVWTFAGGAFSVVVLPEPASTVNLGNARTSANGGAIVGYRNMPGPTTAPEFAMWKESAGGSWTFENVVLPTLSETWGVDPVWVSNDGDSVIVSYADAYGLNQYLEQRWRGNGDWTQTTSLVPPGFRPRSFNNTNTDGWLWGIVTSTADGENHALVGRLSNGTWTTRVLPFPIGSLSDMSNWQPLLSDGVLLSGNPWQSEGRVAWHVPTNPMTDAWPITVLNAPQPSSSYHSLRLTTDDWLDPVVFGCSVIPFYQYNNDGTYTSRYWGLDDINPSSPEANSESLPAGEAATHVDDVYAQRHEWFLGWSYPTKSRATSAPKPNAFVSTVGQDGLEFRALPNIGTPGVAPAPRVAEIWPDGSIVVGNAYNDAGVATPVAWHFNNTTGTYGAPIPLPQPADTSGGARTIQSLHPQDAWDNPTLPSLPAYIEGTSPDRKWLGYVPVSTLVEPSGFRFLSDLTGWPSEIASFDWTWRSTMHPDGGLDKLIFTAGDGEGFLGSYVMFRDATAVDGYGFTKLMLGTQNVEAIDIGANDVIVAHTSASRTSAVAVFTPGGTSGTWIGQAVAVTFKKGEVHEPVQAYAAAVANRAVPSTGWPLVAVRRFGRYDDQHVAILQADANGTYRQVDGGDVGAPAFATPNADSIFMPFHNATWMPVDGELWPNAPGGKFIAYPSQSGFVPFGFVGGALISDPFGEPSYAPAMQVWNPTTAAWQLVMMPFESDTAFVGSVGTLPGDAKPVAFGFDGNFPLCKGGTFCDFDEFTGEAVAWHFADVLAPTLVPLTPAGFWNVMFREPFWTTNSRFSTTNAGSTTLGYGEDEDGNFKMLVFAATADTVLSFPTEFITPGNGLNESFEQYHLGSTFIQGSDLGPECIWDWCERSKTPYLWGCSVSPGVTLDSVEVVYRTDRNPSVSYDLAVQRVCQTSVTNNATISTVDMEITEANNNDSVTLPIATTDIAVMLYADPGVAQLDDTITYTAEVTNYGPTTAQNVVLNVSIPAGDATTYNEHTINIGTLSAGQTLTYNNNWSTTVSTSAAGVNFIASAEVTTTSIECNTADNTSTALTITGELPNVFVRKSAPSVVPLGQPFTYTIVFGNNGNADATNVLFTDVLPAGLSVIGDPDDWDAFPPGCSFNPGTLTIVCSADTLDAGTEFTLTVPVVMNDCTAANTSVTNTATVNADDDINTADNVASATTSITPTAAQVQLTTVASHGNLESGEQVTFFVYYRNVGTEPVIAPNTLTATVPAGTGFVHAGSGSHSGGIVTWTLPTNLEPGESGSVAFTVLVNAAAPTTLISTATFDAVSPLASGTCDVSATATTNVTGPGLHLVKQASAAMTCNGNITWTLTATNTGATTATNLIVTDTIPAGLSLVANSILGPNPSVGGSTVTWNIPSLAPGGAISMAFVTTPPAGNGSTAANSATLSAGGTTVTTTPVVVQNDCNQAMAITKAWDNVCAQPGDTITVTLTATNTGTTGLTNVRVRDVVQNGLTVTTVNNSGNYVAPNITWIIGDVAAGQTRTVTWTATLTAPSGDTFHNVATMTANGVEPTTSNQVNGVVLNCNDGNTCTTDSCDPFVGCVNTLTPNGLPELCDGVDNDCDGSTDAADVTTSFGAPWPANGGLVTTLCSVQAGVCQGSMTTPELCVNGVWLPCTTEIFELHSDDFDLSDHECDGIDSNCNGTADEGYDPSETTCGLGVCAATGLLECINGVEVDSCVPLVTTFTTDTLCNGRDDDCDGSVLDEETEFVSTTVSCGENACALVGTGTTFCLGGTIGNTCDEVWQNISDIGDDMCLDTTPPVGTPANTLVVVYLVVQNAQGQDAGSVRCWQDTTNGNIECDSTIVNGISTLTVYPDLLCLPPEGGNP